jgi:hypothetical protein
VSVTAGLVVLVYAIVKPQDNGWGSRQHARPRAVARRCSWRVRVSSSSRSVAPLVRLGIFRVRTLAPANVILFIVVGGLFGMFSLRHPLRAADPRLLAAGGRLRVPAVTFGIIAGAGSRSSSSSASGSSRPS